MSCRIIRDNNYKVLDVLAENGKTSFLFRDISKIFPNNNSSLALKAYSNLVAPKESIEIPVNNMSSTTSNETNIKPGVQELFESNPELANSVYEALGFLYSPLTNENKTKIDNRAKEELAVFNRLLALTKKNNFNEAYDVLVDRIIEAGKDINRRKEYIELLKFQEYINTYFGYLINDKNDKTAKDTKITDVINEIKEQAEKDKLKRKRNEITPQQKQEAQQLYQSFLDVYLQDFEQVESILKEKKIIDKKCS